MTPDEPEPWTPEPSDRGPARRKPKARDPAPVPFQPRDRAATEARAATRTPRPRGLSRISEELLPRSVAERLEGSEILLVVKPTPKAILAAALPFALLLAIVLLLPLLLGPAGDFLFRPIEGPDVPGDAETVPEAFDLLRLLAILEAPFFILLAVLGGRLFRNVGLLFTTYVVTEREVVSHFSFLAERIRHVPHEKLTDIRIRQGVIPRLLGYSDLTVEAYTQGARVEMRGVGPGVQMLHLLSDRARVATSIRYMLEAD